MPTATHGSVMGALFNGYDLSPFLNTLSDSMMVDAVKETCFGPLGTPVTAESYIPGLSDATLDTAGKYAKDTAVGEPNHDQIADILEAAIRGARDVVTSFPWGDGFGQSCTGYLADVTSYDVQNPVAGIVSVATKLQSSVGADPLQVLHPLTAEASPGANGADLDAGAGYVVANWKGVNAYLHVTGVTGGAPSLGAKVQHSIDGITWVDLATFTAVTAAHKAQRLQVLGTVNRHLRAVWTVAAGTTATFHLSAGRIPA